MNPKYADASTEEAHSIILENMKMQLIPAISVTNQSNYTLTY